MSGTHAAGHHTELSRWLKRSVFSHLHAIIEVIFQGTHCAACAGELLGARGGGAEGYIGTALECAAFSREAWVTVSAQSGEPKLAAVVSNEITG